MTPYHLLLSMVEIGKIHEGRLHDALEHLKNFLPMDENKLAVLTKDDYAYLDVMSVRYAKLQDLIGSKIFYLLIDVLSEPIEGNRFLDVLNHLEKIGIIESVNFWIDLRNIRNFIAHEYPEKPEILLKNINILHASSLKLLDFWQKLKNEIQKIRVNG